MRGIAQRTAGALQIGVLATVFLAVGTAGCSAQRGGTSTLTEPSMGLVAGDHDVRLAHGGYERRYVVHIPASAGTRPALVLALHGGGGSGTQFKKDNGLDEVSDREGFIAVYPNGTGRLSDRLLTWNSGKDCCGYALDHDVDDVGFLLALLDDLQGRAPYDAGRVYVTGHSNGSMMAYRLAAEAADRVAAVVAVGGAMDLDDPRPSRAVPILHIHSVDDSRALYEGGEGPPFPGTNRTVQHAPVLDGLEVWAHANGCGSDPVEIESRRGRGADRGQTLTLLRWEGCADGSTVEHLRLTGVGHGWPGVEAGRLLQRLLGPATHLIQASEEAWRFASRFQRPVGQ